MVRNCRNNVGVSVRDWRHRAMIGLAALLLVSSCGLPQPETRPALRNEALCREETLLGSLGDFDSPGSDLDEITTRARACAREQAFQMAPGPDGADVIARAVSYACRDNAFAYADAAEDPHRQPNLRRIARTQSRAMEIITEYATVNVLRARAGHCDASDGALALRPGDGSELDADSARLRELQIDLHRFDNLDRSDRIAVRRAQEFLIDQPSADRARN